MKQPTQEVSPFMTFQETMAFLRVSRSTLCRMIASGKIKGFHVGQNWRFKREDVQKCVETDALALSSAKS
jgi:excisionase family DNA binding protein